MISLVGTCKQKVLPFSQTCSWAARGAPGAEVLDAVQPHDGVLSALAPASCAPSRVSVDPLRAGMLVGLRTSTEYWCGNIRLLSHFVLYIWQLISTMSYTIQITIQLNWYIKIVSQSLGLIHCGKGWANSVRRGETAVLCLQYFVKSRFKGKD